jgi:hypothetical protein
MPEAAQEGNRQGLEGVMTKSHELAQLENRAVITLAAARYSRGGLLR